MKKKFNRKLCVRCMRQALIRFLRMDLEMSLDELETEISILHSMDILILLIFGVMLTTKITNVELKTKNLNVIPSVIFSLGIVTILIFIIFSTKWNIKQAVENEETITHIGKALLSTYLLPFEIASVVLLVALIGSAMFARKIKD